MRAHQLYASQQPAALRDVPVPEPAAGEVLVKVGGAGLCHSDLHLMQWPMSVPAPFTLGHETAGWVEALGPGARGFDVGEAVIVHGAWGCGTCRRCRADLEQYCEAVAASGGPRGCGLGRDGGLAEYLVVPATRHLVSLGDLDPRLWAPLDDAALTPYHALKRCLPLCTPDNWVLVQGVGGLGHAAIQLVKQLTGARVLAADISDDKLLLAGTVGADATLRADAPGAADVVKEITGGQGVAVVLDCVGVDSSMSLASRVVHEVSHIVVVGIGMGTLPLSYLAVPFETTVSTTFWGTVTELRELVALASAGRITFHVEQLRLEDVVSGYERLEAGGVKGRLVAAPHG